MAAVISGERLLQLLRDGYGVDLDNGGVLIDIESLYGDGYQVTPDEKKPLDVINIKTADELFSLLKNIGAGEGQFSLIRLNNDVFESAEELEDYLAFEKISMADLLKKYPQADGFELVTPFYNTGISDEEADRAYAKVAAVMRDGGRRSYEDIPKEQRAALPDFDELYAQIVGECRAHRAANAEEVSKNFGNDFDREHAASNLDYKGIEQLRSIYGAADFAECCAFHLGRLKAVKEKRAQDYELEKYPSLKEALIGAEITFVWGRNVSSLPSKAFKFRLNGKTREWLLTHKDDYDFDGEGFEDLALYCGEKLLFSSCTHEHFHENCDK